MQQIVNHPTGSYEVDGSHESLYKRKMKTKIDKKQGDNPDSSSFPNLVGKVKAEDAWSSFMNRLTKAEQQFFNSVYAST